MKSPNWLVRWNTSEHGRARKQAWKKTPRGRYSGHKEEAARRGIPFLLTFEQWWKIWQDSGHWEARGYGPGKYVMARHGDVGPYAEGNVSIISHQQNVRDGMLKNKNWLRRKNLLKLKPASV